jgi:large subunit ribosomal protein L1
MAKKGKAYRQSAELITKESYSISEAVALIKKTSKVKFDATAELHVNTNIDAKKNEQQLRGTIALPHGTGKKVRIAALVGDDKAKEAKAAGADAAGLEDLLEEFSKGKINYDVIIAVPSVMKQLGKVAKILGQKGLMPNPKSGTVSDDIVKTIKELQGGRVEYRNDKDGNFHLGFGKISFKEEELENNLKAILRTLREAKPATMKGTFIQSMSISSTMGPGIILDVNESLKSL